jgi:hypothetical protein
MEHRSVGQRKSEDDGGEGGPEPVAARVDEADGRDGIDRLGGMPPQGERRDRGGEAFAGEWQANRRDRNPLALDGDGESGWFGASGDPPRRGRARYQRGQPGGHGLDVHAIRRRRWRLPDR